MSSDSTRPPNAHDTIPVPSLATRPGLVRTRAALVAELIWRHVEDASPDEDPALEELLEAAQAADRASPEAFFALFADILKGNIDPAEAA